MQRIYLPNTQFSQNLTLDNTEIHHQLTRVLRSKIGDEVIFFDGKILEDRVYKIEAIDKKTISFSLQNRIQKNSELEFSLMLYQALPNKLEKLEYIVQKCCEVGFSQIIFFPSERSQKLVLSEKKQQRLQKIAQEATEQSGRNSICELTFVTARLEPVPVDAGKAVLYSSKIASLRSQGQNQINIVFHQESSVDSKLIKDIPIKNGQAVSIYVGPEGGFSDNEIQEFESSNFQKVYLGERILRCETAGAVTGFFLSQNL